MKTSDLTFYISSHTIVVVMEQLKDLVYWLGYFGITKERITPLAIGFGLLYYLLQKLIKEVKSDVDNTKLCVVEMRSIMKVKLKGISFEQAIKGYGEAKSPVVLKDEFKHFITDVGLDKQIEGKKEELIEWLKKQEPKTGIDAQDDIYDFVVSKEIEKYLDLTKYKENLYQKGKTAIDVEAIVGIYLFGVLIPELFPEKKK